MLSALKPSEIFKLIVNTSYPNKKIISAPILSSQTEIKTVYLQSKTFQYVRLHSHRFVKYHTKADSVGDLVF